MENEMKYPGSEIIVNGKRYIQLNMDVFIQLFKDVSILSGVKQEMIDLLINEYHRASKFKKKRIRHKRIKQIMKAMYGIMIAVHEIDQETLQEIQLVELG